MVGRFALADWQRLSGGKTGAVSDSEQQEARKQFQAIHGGGGGGGGGQLRPPPGSAAAVQPFVWTATPATRLAGLYLHAFNSGDAEQMRTFIDKSLATDPSRSTEQRVEAYRGMFRDHGAMAIVGTESALHNEATIRVRSKRGEFSVIVTISTTDHARAESIRLVGAQ